MLKPKAQSPESKTMLRQVSKVQMDYFDTMHAMGIEAVSAVSPREPSRGGQQNYCMGSNRIQYNTTSAQFARWPAREAHLSEMAALIPFPVHSKHCKPYLREPFLGFQSKGYE